MTRRLTKGAERALLAMTGEWQRAGNATFNWAGAGEAFRQAPDLCEWMAIKHPRRKYAYTHYRLTDDGLAFKAAHLFKAAQS